MNQAGLAGRVEVDSAGTGGWHVGAPPDRRMAETAARRGTDLSRLRARQLTAADLDHYDHVFVMDKGNLHDTLALIPEPARAEAGGDHGTRVRLFREFDPEPGDYQVPDPYYGGADGFGRVYDMADRTTTAILRRLADAHGWALDSPSA